MLYIVEDTFSIQNNTKFIIGIDHSFVMPRSSIGLPFPSNKNAFLLTAFANYDEEKEAQDKERKQFVPSSK